MYLSNGPPPFVHRWKVCYLKIIFIYYHFRQRRTVFDVQTYFLKTDYVATVMVEELFFEYIFLFFLNIFSNDVSYDFNFLTDIKSYERETI